MASRLSMWIKPRVFPLFMILLLPVTGRAEFAADRWSVNGFITQGYFKSDHNNIYGDSEDGSFDFRELAVNASYRANAELFLAGQLMSRKAGHVDDGSPQVDYLLADYRFVDNQAYRLGARIGRLKIPYGLYNDTRDVAFTRPSVMLPQSLYIDLARDLELSADGAALYGSFHILDAYRIDVDLLIGEPKKDRNVEYAYLSQDWPGAFDDSIGYMGRLTLSDTTEQWKTGITLGGFTLEYDDKGLPAGAGGPSDGDVEIQVAVLSGQYNTERWSFTGEYMLQHVDWTELGGVFALDPENDFEAWYLQAQYRINPSWELILRYDVQYLDRDDKDGTKTAALFGKPAHTQFAKDLTLGVGWRPNADWLLRAEWHLVEGTSWVPEQDNRGKTLEEDWNLFSLQATYRF